MKKNDTAPSTELVFLGRRTDEPYTTSDIIAEHTGNKHDTVQHLIRKYESDFQDFGKVGFEMRPSMGSRTGQFVKIYHLNEEQTTLLLTYLKNTPKIRAFKKELVRQFYEMRRLLLERQSEQWQQTRSDGKAVRRLETDAIEAFVDYAAANGSKHSEHYYLLFTTMVYRIIGIESGKRELLPAAALRDLQMLEQVVEWAVWAELAAGTEYHEAFQNVKTKVQQIALLAFAPLPETAALSEGA